MANYLDHVDSRSTPPHHRKAAPHELPRDLLHAVDDALEVLARGLVTGNERLSGDQLTLDVRQTVLQILFLQLLGQREGLPLGSLQELNSGQHIQQQLCERIKPFSAAWSAATARIDDTAFRLVLDRFQRVATSGRAFENDAALLGGVYEHLLSREIRFSSRGRPKLDGKSRRRKTGGRYYTPSPVIDYMIDEAIDPLIANGSPRDVPQLRIVDPACGGGAFLLRVYRRLLAEYGDRDSAAGAEFPADGPHRSAREASDPAELTRDERLRILRHGLFGVDIDPYAVEVARLSLLIELLTLPTHAAGRRGWKAFIKASVSVLSDNLKTGDALVGPRPLDGPRIQSSTAENTHGLTPFDWRAAFPTVFSGVRSGFDVVLGNPPYIDSEEMTVQAAALREYCSTHYRTARGNWDLFCVFVERAFDLCRDGGRVCLLVPNKLASAEYAAGVRGLIGRENRLLSLRDYSDVPLFNASVYPLVFVAARERPCPQHQTVNQERVTVDETGALRTIQCRLSYERRFECAEAPWSFAAGHGETQLLDRLRQFPQLSRYAQVWGAATVAEAYAIKSLIMDAKQTEASGYRVVNSGTIDRYRSLWGEKRLRYLGGTYLRPVIPANHIMRLPAKRRLQSRSPKIVVAGLTRRLECLLDAGGELLAGKSTSIVMCEWDLRYVLALLNSKLMSFYFQSVYGGNRMQGGYLRVGPPQLRTVPIALPTDRRSRHKPQVSEIVGLVDEIQALAHRLNEPDSTEAKKRGLDQMGAVDQRIDELVYSLYCLGDAERDLVEKAMRGTA